GIAVTGIIHWFLLRPLLDLHGADLLADKLLHVVVPLLAVGGWVAFGPRGLIRSADLAPSAIFPALYLAWTLIHGAVSGWYPYPFVDVDEHGYLIVLLNTLGVIVLLTAICLLALRLDRRLPRGR
ncbi:MAG TPA: Pr6Pr family membrane protein, partial [Nocardioides sp.]|nr:Pr6Pr family membrane protein [Nocardioides sp.]